MDRIYEGEVVEAEVYEPGSGGSDTFSQAQHAVVPFNPVIRQRDVPAGQLPGAVGHILGDQSMRQRRNFDSYAVYGGPLILSAANIHKLLTPRVGPRIAGIAGGIVGGILGGLTSEKIMHRGER
jgi:hypothetical protein